MNDENNQNNISSYINKFFLLAITIILGFVAWQSKTWTSDIKLLSDSVSKLNAKMEVVVVQLTMSNEMTKKIESDVDRNKISINDHEARIRVLEKK